MTDFMEIDARRASAKLTRQALCARAGIDPDTYRRTARGVTEPNVKTLRKLKAALDACIAEQEARANGNG